MADDAGNVQQIQRTCARGLTLNTKNLFSTGPKATVEFRLFAGTMDAFEVIAAIVSAVGLCQRAAQSHE
ncbi:MAG: hypothetical protein WCG26_09500 [Chloroflexales bacterium]